MIELRKTARFARWLDEMRDLQGRARIQARIARLAAGKAGNPGDVAPVGEGVSEFARRRWSGIPRVLHAPRPDRDRIALVIQFSARVAADAGRDRRPRLWMASNPADDDLFARVVPIEVDTDALVGVR